MIGALRPARIVVLRGHQANPWELRPWEDLDDRFHVTLLETARNWFDTSSLRLHREHARTVRGGLPRGRIGDVAVRVPGERYLNLRRHLEDADIVHSQELGYWYSAQAARLRPKLGFKLVLTVWETLPFRATYRNLRTRPYRELTLREADLFLPTTERARRALLLEGADPDRIRVCAPGVDLERFGGVDAPPAHEHVIVSAGRLVWEKGHQDVLRALAALARDDRSAPPRVVIVGSGPEEARLKAYARDLGVEGHVEFRSFVPYDEMPRIFASASCLVLASLPTVYWEEQFGMVLAEGMAAGLPIVAARSGAIPEVVGDAGLFFPPGDWAALAESLQSGPLSRPPGTRAAYPPERVRAYGRAAAGARLAAAYEELLGRG